MPRLSARTPTNAADRHARAHADIVGNALIDARALLALLERINVQLGERALASWPEPVRKALPKARAYGFYLGLNDYGWLEALCEP